MAEVVVGGSVLSGPKADALAFEGDPFARYYRRGASQKLWDAIGSGRSGLIQKVVGRLGKSSPGCEMDAAMAATS